MINYCKVSLIILLILILSAFVPVIQVLLVTINGGFLSLFVKGDENTWIYIINSLGSVLFLISYYYSDVKVFKGLCAFVFLFFFFPTVLYLTEEVLPQEPYFLGMLLIGLLSGGILLAADILKFKLK